MRAFILCLAVCFPLAVWSQDKPIISGNIIDKETGEPIAYANVGLYEAGSDQPLSGTFSNQEGAFRLKPKDVTQGHYDVLIQFVGYDNYQKKGLVITPETENLRLGVIKIVRSSEELEEVVVQGEEVRRSVETTLDGLTIHPENNLSNVGGTVLDILENTPSVTVGQDGGVTIRGSSSTNVMINGRNSVLADALDQLPASAVENIQVVNNPNARYDAQGTGGVINIKLKKGAQNGTHGQTKITLGNRNRMNTSLRINHQNDVFNVYGGYNFRYHPSIGTSESERTVFGDNPRHITQNRDIERNHKDHTLNYGLDYFLPKSKLSYEGVFEIEDQKDTETTYSHNRNLEDQVTINNIRDNVETEDERSLDNSLIFTKEFAQKDREFRASVSHSYRNDDEIQNIATRPLEADEAYEPLQQRSITAEQRHVMTAQADYVHPLARGKIEAGYKSVFRRLDNDYVLENLDNASEAWIHNDTLSNHFLYQEQVHALYGIYTHSFDQFEFSLGTRLEGTLIDTRLYNTGEEHQQRYIDPFPSVQTLYHLSEAQSLKFTYSRRIDRPGSRHLNPFPDISDSLNIRSGNPDLKPEYIQSLEFGHKVSFTHSDLTSTLFYRRTNNKVDWILTVDDQGVSHRMPDNLISGTDYGLEIIGTSILASWWDMNGSVSLFRSVIDGSNLDQSYMNASFAWNAKLVSNMTLPWDLGFQMTGNYESPEVEAQGIDYARYDVDMSLHRKLFVGKGSISLTVRDVFNTSRFGGENNTDTFRSTFLHKRDTRRAYLTLDYKF